MGYDRREDLRRWNAVDERDLPAFQLARSKNGFADEPRRIFCFQTLRRQMHDLRVLLKRWTLLRVGNQPEKKWFRF